MSRLPVLIEAEEILRRLESEERVAARRLADLEDQLRGFEDIDRPRYEQWIRMELGTLLSALEELHERIRERRILVARINHFIEKEGYLPREALYLASHREEPPEETHGDHAGEEPAPDMESKGSWDPDEIEARRRAKREAKRSARKESRKESRRGSAQGTMPGGAPASREESPGRKGILSLYRALARKLHPDSPDRSSEHPESRLQALWLEVHAAYQAHQPDRLLAIAAWLDTSGAETRVLSPEERRERIRAQLKSQGKLERKLAQLMAHPAWQFTLQKGSARRKLRQLAARELDEDLARAQEALEAFEDFIQSIGSPRVPKRR